MGVWYELRQCVGFNLKPPLKYSIEKITCTNIKMTKGIFVYFNSN